MRLKSFAGGWPVRRMSPKVAAVGRVGGRQPRGREPVNHPRQFKPYIWKIIGNERERKLNCRQVLVWTKNRPSPGVHGTGITGDPRVAPAFLHCRCVSLHCGMWNNTDQDEGAHGRSLWLRPGHGLYDRSDGHCTHFDWAKTIWWPPNKRSSRCRGRSSWTASKWFVH